MNYPSATVILIIVNHFFIMLIVKSHIIKNWYTKQLI